MATATVSRVSGGKNVRKPEKGTKATGSTRRGGRKSSFPNLVSKALVSGLKGHGDNISVVDAAEIFGVTTQTVRQWIKSGYLPDATFPNGFTDRKLYFQTSELVRSIEAAIAKGVAE